MPGYNPVLGSDHPDGPDSANSGREKWNAQHEEAFERIEGVEGQASITDHGQLSGLADDDHAQYHNDTRGDARYYTKTQLDTSLAAKASTGSVAAVQTNLNDHLADNIDAHDALAISFQPTGTIAATNVQSAIAEVANEAGSGGGFFSYVSLIKFGAA
jgi:hypothetical protein